MRKNLAALGLFSFSILLGFSVGSQIFRHLPIIPIFNNPYEIVSPLVEQNYHPINNILRFLVLLLCPVLAWLALGRLLPSYRPSALPSETPENRWEKRVWWAGVMFFLLFGAMEFYLGFRPRAYPDTLDVFWAFHEAEWLMPAWNWWISGKIWSASFFAHGAFYDVFSAAMAWKFFDGVSISASRIMVNFLTQLTIFANLAFLIAASYFGFASRRHLAALFCLGSLYSVYALTQHFHFLERRDLPVLLGLCFFLLGLCREKRWPFFVTGLFAACSWLYTIDRGVYFTASIGIVLIATALLTRKFRQMGWNLLLALGGIVFGLGLFAIWIGSSEFLEGVRTTLFHFQIKDLSDGSPYPPPGFPITNAKFLFTTHTFPLVALCVQVLAFFVFLQRNRWKVMLQSEWLVQLCLLVFSLVYYRSALARCDEIHFRYVSTFAFLGMAYVAVQAVVHSRWWQLRFGSIFFLGLALLFPAKIFLGMLQNIPEKMVSDLSLRKQPVHEADNFYLSDWQKEIHAFLREEFRDEKCFYSLANEPLWPFLLRKPSCGRFYLTWLISDTRLQKMAIAELAQHMPGKILMHTPNPGDEIDGIQIERRVRHLYNFISEHYRPYRTHKGWEVWIRKKAEHSQRQFDPRPLERYAGGGGSLAQFFPIR